MEKHFACQIDADVHAMVTGGSLGEASTLSFEEKLDVTRIALNVADKRIPVLANVTKTRTTNALRLVEQAAKMGVQGFMVMHCRQPMRAKRETICAQLPTMVYSKLDAAVRYNGVLRVF